MKGLLKTSLVGAAIVATAFAAAAPANARDWHHHGYYRHHHNNVGGVVAAGALGVAAGAVLGSVLAPPPAPVYVQPDPYPRYYRPAPRVVYVNPSAEPWTPAWYDGCSARYRTFDARSGTFVGYDGARHFCTLN